MFAPVEDRDTAGIGFTRKAGDIPSIPADKLGTLENQVTSCEAAPPWNGPCRVRTPQSCQAGTAGMIGSRRTATFEGVR